MRQETLQTLENPTHPNYEIIGELADCEEILRAWAENSLDIARSFLETNPQGRIIIPLNGGLTPLVYLLQKAAEQDSELANKIRQSLIWAITDISDENLPQVNLSQEIGEGPEVLVIDDIADTIHTLQALKEALQPVVLTASMPVCKPGTMQKAQKLGFTLQQAPENTGNNHIYVHAQAPEVWICSGCGMNEGNPEVLPQDANPDLLQQLWAYQRICKFGTNRTKNPQTAQDLQNEINWLKQNALSILESPEIQDLLVKLERAKNSAEVQEAFELADQILNLLFPEAQEGQ